jgi:SAM-dependent methyltransferase
VIVAAAPPTRSPLAVYGAALRRADVRLALTAVDAAGPSRSVRPGEWCQDARPGDDGLLSRCRGAVLDVGCGAGRLTSALAARGHVALGVDVSADAVRLARRRGVRALRRDVFAPLPDEGGWARVLLADGNIGINGEPVRLLRRCRGLAAPTGRILVELDPPGGRTWAGQVRLTADDGVPSAPFPWAYVAVDHLALFARAAGLRILEHWTEAGRWFAALS